MQNNKKVIYIFGGILAVTGLILFFIPPKAKVVIRKDGSGTATLGGKTKDFTREKGVDITTFNGYELHADKDDIWLRKWGRDVVNKDGTTKVDVQIG
jgi:hypothetical protein